MSSRVSPFASLTGEEKQIRWLEYQSVTLPYVQGSVEPLSVELDIPIRKEAAPAKPAPEPPAPRRETARREPESAPKPPAPSPADFQKTRHKQYDAVIARMKQAEKSVRVYQPVQ